MKKRKKLTHISDVPSYHSFNRATINGNKGYIYQLCEPLTDDNRIELQSKFNNIDFLTIQREYAPEIKCSALFVADRALNNFKTLQI